MLGNSNLTANAMAYGNNPSCKEETSLKIQFNPKLLKQLKELIPLVIQKEHGA
jgi:hypothetical protein